MKVSICSIGKLPPKSEERALATDYLDRFNKTGRPLGWSFAKEAELDDRKIKGMAAEAGALRTAIPSGSVLVALDERGKVISSPDFSKQIAAWADQGRDVCFVIGGADGIDPGLRADADYLLSFGKMVWPHKLVKVMLAEQLYRAATIKAGSPYHRT